MPVEKIREVIKEVKVPVFIQAHHQGSFNDHNFRGNGNNFEDSFFGSSKNLEQIRNHFKKQKQQELINDEEDENFRRNININRQRQKNSSPQNFPPPKFPYHLQQPQQNQPSQQSQINHQINHNQQNQISGRQQGQNQPSQQSQINHQINHNQQNQINHQINQNSARQQGQNQSPVHFNHQQFHSQQQVNNQQQFQQLNQQNQEKSQHLIVSIPKNFNKNPVSSPQPPTSYNTIKNQGNPQQIASQQENNQNQKARGSFNVQQNFKVVHTPNPVDDHATEASTQYESYSPLPNIHYGRPIEHSQPQVYYEPLPAASQQHVQYPQAYLQPEPNHQAQYQQHAQPQAFSQSNPQAVINKNTETFQPSFGVPQQTK